MLCEQCGVWELLGSDNYCGWCGKQFISYSLRLEPPRAYVYSYSQVKLIIDNSGKRDLQNLRIEFKPDSDHIQVTAEDLPASVESEHCATVTLNVDTLSLDEGYHEVVIRVSASIDSDESAMSEISNEIKLHIGQPPELDCTVIDYEIHLISVPAVKQPARISLTRGFGTVKQVSIDAASSLWAKVASTPASASSYFLDARKQKVLPLDLEFDLTTLKELSNRGIWEHHGNLLVSVAELDNDYTVPFKVTCSNPPAIGVQETDTLRKEFRAELGEIFSLTIENKNPHSYQTDQRRGVLEIYNVEIKNTNGTPCDWISPLSPIGFPLRVASDSSRQLEYVVRSSEEPVAPSRHIGLGNHDIDVVITSNDPARSSWSHTFKIAVLPMEDFKGILTIDFGTSNTCCALVEPSGREKKRLVPIDERPIGQSNESGTTAPSAIHYMRALDDGIIEYEIGSGALALAHAFPASVVISAKRDLGSKTVFDVIYSKSQDGRQNGKPMTPREVVTDYLRRVKKHAEMTAKARIKNLIIAHPSRFSIEQIRELEDSARTAFGSNCQIEKIPEPIGAAMDFIVTDEAWAHAEYTLMVYDFGGGTTDITLLKVENKLIEGHREVFPTPLGATGSPQLGGTDVTEIILQLGLARCLERMRQDYPNEKVIEILVAPEEYRNKDRQKKAVAQKNREELLRWAEATKIFFSTGLPEDSQKIPEKLYLPVYVGKDIKEEAFPNVEIAPSREEMNEKLEQFLGEGVAMMKELAAECGTARPDIILLAGKSSSLPLVSELIEVGFSGSKDGGLSGSKIVLAKKLKECVIDGACVKVLHQEAAWEPRINLKHDYSMNFTTSRLGLVGNKGGQQIFSKVVGAGRPIPNEGLKERISGLRALRREDKITIYENTGGQDVFKNNGNLPEQLKIIGLYSFDDIPSDVSPIQLEHAILWLVISHDLRVSIEVTIEGRVGKPIIMELGRTFTY